MCVKEKTSRCSAMWDCLVSFECVCMRVRVYLCLVKYACETKRVGVVPTDCLVSFQRVCVCVCERERERVYFCMHVCMCVWEEETGCSTTWHCLVGFDCVFMCFCIWVFLHTFAHFDSTTATLWRCDYACCFIIVALWVLDIIVTLLLFIYWCIQNIFIKSKVHRFPFPLEKHVMELLRGILRPKKNPTARGSPAHSSFSLHIYEWFSLHIYECPCHI